MDSLQDEHILENNHIIFSNIFCISKNSYIYKKLMKQNFYNFVIRNLIQSSIIHISQTLNIIKATRKEFDVVHMLLQRVHFILYFTALASEMTQSSTTQLMQGQGKLMIIMVLFDYKSSRVLKRNRKFSETCEGI